jgi:group I intron endonuclease
MELIDINSLPNDSGIYKITSPTGRIYIGEAISLRERCMFYLNPNRIKRQRAIYNSLIKYGVEIHTNEIKELCDQQNLFERERYWQEYYDSVENGLNCHYTSTTNKKKIHSKETISIMSKKASGINNSFYGKKHSEESLQKISESSKGENNPNWGGKFKTDDYLKKQSLSNSKKPILVIDTSSNEEYIFPNSKEASKFIGCNPGVIRTAKRHGYKIRKRYIVNPA